MSDHLNARYLAYMRSDKWRRIRERAFEFYGRVCGSCGATEGLEVHHRTYERFGRENVGDLQVLCGDCHVCADIRRKRDARERKEWPLMEVWAREKYGPEWWNECDPIDMLARYRKARTQAINDSINKGFA